ncbi:hypothetical protein EG68_08907 [Paragonimus skrjabini miyazakii]|uniref:Uncharacterized protein n=1 Tax=Paragonimus skrjabini miyazakii TaxID=59628 RepID=A0A8S9YNM5_9TREM|nr:hypothetical protein EG68_08907 [Paragonimus skrjabini miyazakii]
MDSLVPRLLLAFVTWTFLNFNILLLQGVNSQFSKQHDDCIRRLRADVVFLVDASNFVDVFSYEFYVKDYLNDVVKMYRQDRKRTKVQ